MVRRTGHYLKCDSELGSGVLELLEDPPNPPEQRVIHGRWPLRTEQATLGVRRWLWRQLRPGVIEPIQQAQYRRREIGNK
jgi:hypothetical protein